MTPTVNMRLTSDPSLRVHHQLQIGEELHFEPGTRIRFRSGQRFSLRLSPESPFDGVGNTIKAELHGKEWLVEAKFRPDAATAAPEYTVEIDQALAAAASPGTGRADPQVEIILEQY